MVRPLLLVCALLAVAGSAHAGGVVSMTWDGCTGPVTRSVAPGSVPALFVSLIGQSDPLASYGFKLMVSRDCTDPLHPNGGPIPDAWRFDPAGCQGGLLAVDAAPVTPVPSCPSLVGTGSSLTIGLYDYDDVTGVAVFNLIREFVNGGVIAPDPSVRYLVARLRFSQEFGVIGPSGPDACGGLENPLCIQLVATNYNTGEVVGEWARANACVSVNDPNGASGCNVPTSARATTWGAIRGQYR